MNFDKPVSAGGVYDLPTPVGSGESYQIDQRSNVDFFKVDKAPPVRTLRPDGTGVAIPLPESPDAIRYETRSASGNRVSISLNQADHRIEVKVVDPSGKKTLSEATYTKGVDKAGWASWQKTAQSGDSSMMSLNWGEAMGPGADGVFLEPRVAPNNTIEADEVSIYDPRVGSVSLLGTGSGDTAEVKADIRRDLHSPTERLVGAVPFDPALDQFKINGAT